MGADKKSKDKKKADAREHHRKSQEADNHGPVGDSKKSTPKQKNQHAKSKKAKGWSWLAKLNMLLLLTTLLLAGRALYLHAEGDFSESGLQVARGRLLSSWAALRALSEKHGGRALRLAAEQARLARDWLSERADRLDRYLTETQRPYWQPVKEAGGRARQYAALAGERALMLTAQAASKGWEAAEAGWAAAAPYWDSARAAAAPYWDAALAAATPWWDAAVARGTAVKAGALEAAARLQRDGSPVLLEWTAGARRAAADGWELVQRETPRLAAAAWEQAGRAGAVAWDWLQAGWQVVRSEGPVYAAAAVERVKQAVAALTGAA